MSRTAKKRFDAIAKELTAASKGGYSYRVTQWRGEPIFERKLPSWARWHYVCHADDVREARDGYFDITDGRQVGYGE